MSRRFAARALGYLPYVGCWLALCFSATFSSFAVQNLALQLTLFLFGACLPAWRTHRMSFVDAAWPWGLVGIGAVVLWSGTGWEPRRYVVAAMYLCAGLRMGVPALQLYRPGLLKQDFPRYRYQRIRWQRAGYRSEMLSMQYEILLQGCMNASVLALPALLQAFNPQPRFSAWEVAGYLLWALCLGLEYLADRQKTRFMRAARAANERHRNCDVGLWRYSRHPNYFFEWMVWNALVLSSLPSLFTSHAREPLIVFVALASFLPFVSALMYYILVHYTGAVPAEHYSVQKRPAYAGYQRSTNRFFPGPARNRREIRATPRSAQVSRSGTGGFSRPAALPVQDRMREDA